MIVVDGAKLSNFVSAASVGTLGRDGTGGFNDVVVAPDEALTGPDPATIVSNAISADDCIWGALYSWRLGLGDTEDTVLCFSFITQSALDWSASIFRPVEMTGSGCFLAAGFGGITGRFFTASEGAPSIITSSPTRLFFAIVLARS